MGVMGSINTCSSTWLIWVRAIILTLKFFTFSACQEAKYILSTCHMGIFKEVTQDRHGGTHSEFQYLEAEAN